MKIEIKEFQENSDIFTMENLNKIIKSDSISLRDEPDELTQNEMADILQSDFTEFSIDEPEWAQLSHDALKEIPIDHLADSSQDGQEDEPETAKHTAANSGENLTATR